MSLDLGSHLNASDKIIEGDDVILAHVDPRGQVGDHVLLGDCDPSGASPGSLPFEKCPRNCAVGALQIASLNLVQRVLRWKTPLIKFGSRVAKPNGRFSLSTFEGCH